MKFLAVAIIFGPHVYACKATICPFLSSFYDLLGRSISPISYMVGGLSRTKYSRHVEKVGTKSLHLKILVIEMDVSRCILVLDIFIFNHFNDK